MPSAQQARERASSTSARRAARSVGRFVRRVDGSVSAHARAKWRRRRSNCKRATLVRCVSCRSRIISMAFASVARPVAVHVGRLAAPALRSRATRGPLSLRYASSPCCLPSDTELRYLCSQALHARARMDRVRRQHIDWHRPSTSSTPRPLTPRRSASLTMRKRRWATSSSLSCPRRDLRSPRAVRWSRCEP